jgi:general secretion pathway protein F/type IV pilus assembly protein PilC
LLDALKTIDGERRETGSHAVAHVARQLHEDLDSGLSVSEAVKRRPDVFPETVRNLIVIGDRSGRLDHMLIEAAEHTERMINIGRDIRTALIYPAFVFATLFAVMAFWLVYVVPKLGELFERLNADMPAMTQGLVTFGQLTADYFLHGVAGLAAIVFMTVWVFRRYEPARFGLHTTLHYLPIMRRITLSAGMARLTEHMAILVQSGVDLISTLDVLTQTTTDLYYRRRLQRVSHSVSRGEGVAASMRRVGGFPPMVVRMIGVGESSGSVDEQLRHLAQEYRRRLDVIIGSLGEIIKPLVVLVAGGLFFFMVVALLLPIYNLIGKTMQTSMGA